MGWARRGWHRILSRERTVRQILLAYLIFMAVPTAVYVVAGAHHPMVLRLIHYAVATAYSITAIMVLQESRTAWRRRRAPVSADQTLPSVPLITVIVSAYLPNEQDLIAETILQLSTRMRVPSYRLQIILAYNSPDELPVEEVLDGYARINASFMPLRVANSSSKAQNILAAIPHIRGEMTVLLDADHHPLPDAFERAYRWLLRGYDVVQGRCVIRRQTDNVLSRYIAIEFEQIYAVAHAGRSLGFDTAIFGGSNGYWRTSALRQIGMDRSMLTEDIDSSLRALLAGFKFVHDRSVVSSELAPPSLGAWWSQRLRWAQGWLQVTLKHQGNILRTPHLSSAQKLYWLYMLAWREVFPFLSLQVFALLTAGAVLGRTIDWFSSPYLIGTAILTMAAGPVSALATYRVALWRTQERLRNWFLVYACTALVYTVFKNTVAMVAMVRELSKGGHEWVVTPRARAAEALAEETELGVALSGIAASNHAMVMQLRAMEALDEEERREGTGMLFAESDGEEVEADEVLNLPMSAERRLELAGRSGVVRPVDPEKIARRKQSNARLALELSAESLWGGTFLAVPALLERNLCLRGIWYTSPDRAPGAYAHESDDILGRLAVQCSVGRPSTFDMELVAWVLGRWRPGSSEVTFGLREIAREFGMSWSGQLGDFIKGSLRRIDTIEVQGTMWDGLSGSNVDTAFKLVDRIEMGDPERGLHAPTGTLATVHLSSYLITQLASQAYVALDWRVLRGTLRTPLERRLYVFLEGHRQRGAAYEVPIDHRLLDTLGSQDHRNPARFRQSVAAAGESILSADSGYRGVRVAPGEERGSFVLQVERVA